MQIENSFVTFSNFIEQKKSIFLNKIISFISNDMKLYIKTNSEHGKNLKEFLILLKIFIKDLFLKHYIHCATLQEMNYLR